MPYETRSIGCTHGGCCRDCCSLCYREDSGILTTSEDDYDDDNDESPWYEESGGIIHGHGWSPHPLVFHGRGPWHLGMEIEVNAPQPAGYYDGSFRHLERCAEKVQAGLGDLCWIQEDGSIGYGFEITTHPMTYRYAIKNFPWEVLDQMAEDGFRVGRNVGIHVHVGRAAFSSECHLYRWMKFVYRNAEQVQRLARRRDSEWASFRPEHRMAVKRYMKGHEHAGYDTRYQAINPINPDTLEVRVFASSLKPSEVKAALAFVASTVEYTRDLDANRIIKERGWAWSTYVEWLRAPERDVYRPILDELEALLCVS